MRGVAVKPDVSRLRLGTPTAASSSVRVLPRAALALPVEVVPGHPSNVVDVHYRVDGGRTHVVHAAPATPPLATEPQKFLAHVPAAEGAHLLEYRAELRRAGQVIAIEPADGSWQSFAAAEVNTAAPATPQSPFPEYDTAGTPRFTYGLDFLGALTVQLRAEVLGHTPQGYRINFFVVHGEAHGPRLNGTVRPEGGDWMCIRPDGVGEVDIKITYETPDGALLLEQSGGVFDIGQDGYADVVAGVYRGAPPFFATPVYVTADPGWQWINSLQCFGFGRVVMEHLRVECDIYAPRLESGPSL